MNHKINTSLMLRSLVCKVDDVESCIFRRNQRHGVIGSGRTRCSADNTSSKHNIKDTVQVICVI